MSSDDSGTKIERVRVHRARDQVVITLDLSNLAIGNIDKVVVRGIKHFLELLLSVMPVHQCDDPGEDDFARFCNKFGLKELISARRGFEKLAEPESIRNSNCSCRLTNRLYEADIHTLQQAVLMTRAQLRDLRNFGKTTFDELESKASLYSGLELRSKK
jgi:hypothetical protein